jgi:hypothetical protein
MFEQGDQWLEELAEQTGQEVLVTCKSGHNAANRDHGRDRGGMFRPSATRRTEAP